MQFSERFLYYIWDAGHLQKKMETVSGNELEVLYNGQWNTDSGPDFLGAVVRVGNEILHGDVEIHVKTSDWCNHGHTDNPDYRNVILHVVLDHNTGDTLTRTHSEHTVEIMQLRKQLDSSLGKLLQRYEGVDFTPCDKECEFLQQLSHPQQFFENLGMTRLRKKSNRFAAELIYNDYDQVLWQGMAESLGYSHNKFQMLRLSRHLTYDYLKEFKTSGKSRDAMLGTVLTLSGLLERLPSTFPMIWISKWRELAEIPDEMDILRDIPWKLFRQRPVNHPGIRIMQVAQLLWDSFDGSLFQRFAACFSQPQGKFSVTTMRERVLKLFLDSQGWLPEKYHLGESRIDIFLSIFCSQSCCSTVVKWVIYPCRKPSNTAFAHIRRRRKTV